MVNKISLFSLDPINTERQTELDILKGFSILFMVLVHCFEEFSTWPLAPKTSTYVIEFLGSPPSAPVFMFLLGLGIVYSRNNDAKALFKRGLYLFLFAYALNFFRDFLPNIIVYITTGNIEDYTEAVELFWGVDILQFAGIAFMFFGITKKYRFRNLYYLLASIVFAGLNLVLAGACTGNHVIDSLLGLLWSTNKDSWFPFLTWIIYPVFGYLFGQLLIYCKDKQVLYKLSFYVSFAVLILFAEYSYLKGVDFGAVDGLFQEGYYHHDIIGNITILAFVICWASTVYFITPHIPYIIKRALVRWSKNVTEIYCIHWMIISWSLIVLPTLSLPAIFIFYAILCIVSDFISIQYIKLKKGANFHFKKELPEYQ
ncbi:acyltransferase family protein [Clostridium cellulovorans]|uniref:Acyltransferase 3 domain-containing protein n=1 Tax=Clostridium cellulovorans (strain ATCC 35296 / DSM 3052 / OCM 3 / 743B) TaxID=573061 RepID=D9SVX0_CLOC7|nr:acyltransferase family protein [Clostridium cellulovorans]ADL53181.1 protein of unknown function DUF1624 [Clostridium cellulovorans 743B]